MHITIKEDGDSNEPYMRRLCRVNDFSPAKFILGFVLRHRTGVFQSENNIRPFFLRQETRLFG